MFLLPEKFFLYLTYYISSPSGPLRFRTGLEDSPDRVKKPSGNQVMPRTRLRFNTTMTTTVTTSTETHTATKIISIFGLSGPPGVGSDGGFSAERGEKIYK